MNNYRLILLVSCSITLLRAERCTFLFIVSEIRGSYQPCQKASWLFLVQVLSILEYEVFRYFKVLKQGLKMEDDPVSDLYTGL